MSSDVVSQTGAEGVTGGGATTEQGFGNAPAATPEEAEEGPEPVRMGYRGDSLFTTVAIVRVCDII